MSDETIPVLVRQDVQNLEFPTCAVFAPEGVTLSLPNDVMREGNIPELPAPFPVPYHVPVEYPRPDVINPEFDIHHAYANSIVNDAARAEDPITFDGIPSIPGNSVRDTRMIGEAADRNAGHIPEKVAKYDELAKLVANAMLNNEPVPNIDAPPNFPDIEYLDKPLAIDRRARALEPRSHRINMSRPLDVMHHASKEYDEGLQWLKHIATGDHGNMKPDTARSYEQHLRLDYEVVMPRRLTCEMFVNIGFVIAWFFSIGYVMTDFVPVISDHTDLVSMSYFTQTVLEAAKGTIIYVSTGIKSITMTRKSRATGQTVTPTSDTLMYYFFVNQSRISCRVKRYSQRVKTAVNNARFGLHADAIAHIVYYKRFTEYISDCGVVLNNEKFSPSGKPIVKRYTFYIHNVSPTSVAYDNDDSTINIHSVYLYAGMLAIIEAGLWPYTPGSVVEKNAPIKVQDDCSFTGQSYRVLVEAMIVHASRMRISNLDCFVESFSFGRVNLVPGNTFYRQTGFKAVRMFETFLYHALPCTVTVRYFPSEPIRANAVPPPNNMKLFMKRGPKTESLYITFSDSITGGYIRLVEYVLNRVHVICAIMYSRDALGCIVPIDLGVLTSCNRYDGIFRFIVTKNLAMEHGYLHGYAKQIAQHLNAYIDFMEQIKLETVTLSLVQHYSAINVYRPSELHYCTMCARFYLSSLNCTAMLHQY